MNDKFSREEALEADKFVGVDQPFVYDVEDLMTTVAITGPNYYTIVTGAVEVAMQTGDFVKLAVDADLESSRAAGKSGYNASITATPILCRSPLPPLKPHSLFEIEHSVRLEDAILLSLLFVSLFNLLLVRLLEKMRSSVEGMVRFWYNIRTKKG